MKTIRSALSLLILCCSVTLLLFSACSEGSFSFDAEILEVTENRILVKPLSEDLPYDRISVSLQGVNTNKIKLKVGMTVCIYCGGSFAQSDPVQCNDATRIEVFLS